MTRLLVKVGVALSGYVTIWLAVYHDWMFGGIIGGIVFGSAVAIGLLGR